MVRIHNKVEVYETGVKSYEGIYSLKNSMFNSTFNLINKDKILNLIDNFVSDDGIKEIYYLDCCVIKTKELKEILNTLEYLYHYYKVLYGENPELEGTIDYLKEYIEER